MVLLGGGCGVVWWVVEVEVVVGGVDPATPRRWWRTPATKPKTGLDSRAKSSSVFILEGAVSLWLLVYF